MHKIKTSIAFWVVLALMLPPKAAAEELSYGVKIGLATSFAKGSTEVKEECKQQLEHQLLIKCKTQDIFWNPWLGAALYIEHAFNDHIGLGAELLYNRFDNSFKINQADSQQSGYMAVVSSTHTIGLPVFLTWYWTAVIGPGFKKDCFLGRLFAGLHSFYLVKGSNNVKTILNGKKTAETQADLPFDKNEKRLKFGFIGGTSLEFTSGLLLELKAMLPYNLWSQQDKKARPNVASFHLSLGCNLCVFMG